MRPDIVAQFFFTKHKRIARGCW